MATYIKTMQDKNGDTILPVTNSNAVTVVGGQSLEAALSTKAEKLSAASTSVGTVEFAGQTKSTGKFYGGTTAPTNSTRLNFDGVFYATQVFNAVYNDLAEFMYVKEGEILKPGDILSMTREGLVKADSLDKRVVGVFSDTFGFALGADDLDKKVPIGISGRVLTYIVNEFDIEPGDFVTSAGNGVGVVNNDAPRGTIVGKIFDGVKSADGRYWITISLM